MEDMVAAADQTVPGNGGSMYGDVIAPLFGCQPAPAAPCPEQMGFWQSVGLCKPFLPVLATLYVPALLFVVLAIAHIR